MRSGINVHVYGSVFGIERSKISVLRPGMKDQCSEIKDQRSEIKDQRSEIKDRIKDQCSENKDQFSEIRDQIKDQCSENKDQFSEIRHHCTGISVIRSGTSFFLLRV